VHEISITTDLSPFYEEPPPVLNETACPHLLFSREPTTNLFNELRANIGKSHVLLVEAIKIIFVLVLRKMLRNLSDFCDNVNKYFPAVVHPHLKIVIIAYMLK